MADYPIVPEDDRGIDQYRPRSEEEFMQLRAELLKLRVERDMACSERNMALQALVKMVEARLINSRDAAAKAEVDSPGAQALNAIAVTQKTNRVR
jgi:hypothetical protein